MITKSKLGLKWQSDQRKRFFLKFTDADGWQMMAKAHMTLYINVSIFYFFIKFNDNN